MITLQILYISLQPSELRCDLADVQSAAGDSHNKGYDSD